MNIVEYSLFILLPPYIIANTITITATHSIVSITITAISFFFTVDNIIAVYASYALAVDIISFSYANLFGLSLAQALLI